MTAQAQDKKRHTVSGTVSPELAEFMEDYRWKNRLNRSQVVGNALAEWAKSNGFVETATGEVPADESGPQAPADEASAEESTTPKNSRRAR